VKVPKKWGKRGKKGDFFTLRAVLQRAASEILAKKGSKKS